MSLSAQREIRENAGRIDKMSEWAAGVSKQLKELESKILPTFEQCDRISLELSGLYEQYQDIGASLQDCDITIAKLAHKIADIDGEIEVLEASALIEISCEMTENGKLKYSNDSLRKAAVKVYLNKKEDYGEKIEAKRKAEHEMTMGKATAKSLENSLSEYRNRVRTLTAILSNLTARINANR